METSKTLETLETSETSEIPTTSQTSGADRFSNAVPALKCEITQLVKDGEFEEAKDIARDNDQLKQHLVRERVGGDVGSHDVFLGF